MNNAILVVGGILALLLAGYGVAAYRRRHQRLGDLDAETAAARRAIRLAETARDAGTVDVPDADRALAAASALLSDIESPATARKATNLAQRAERAWNRQNVAMRGRYGTAKSSAKDTSTDSGAKGGSTTESKSDSRPGATTSAESRYAAAIAAQPKLDGASAVKILAVVLLGLIALIFIGNQTQQADTTFEGQDSRSLSLNALPSEPVPSYSQIVAEYGDAPIVTLPGATATLNVDLAEEWLAKADVKQILLTPPLAPAAEESIDVPDDVVLVVGTQVSLSPYTVQPSTFPEMQQVYGAADVTASVIELLATRLDDEAPPDVEPLEWREPTTEELAPVVTALQTDGIAFVGDAEPFEIPEQATAAYPEGVDPLIVVAPHAAVGQPAVNYADAVAEQFPDRPIVVMTGLWIDYAGSYADDFEASLTASFYGQFGNRLQEHAYSQQDVLKVALGRVEQFRHSGIFGKPLPYQAPDPLELTLPALPWICGGLGVAAIVAAIVQIRRQRLDVPTPVGAAALRRLAGLSELAVEVSGLTDSRSQGALTRALRALTEARDVAEGSDEHSDVADELLDHAERELTQVAERIGRPEYRPTNFLNGRWS